MAIILNLETSTTNCSVSISKNGKILALKEQDDAGYTHSENLHVFIRAVVKSASFSLADVDAIAVSKGPGSYTGLRIGVSAVKGLCYSLDKPLISVPTLESLSYQLKIDEGFIIPLLDARRMEVYSAVFDKDHHQVRDTEAEIIDSNSFSDFLAQGKTYFIGSGAEKCKGIINHPHALFSDRVHAPSAKEMALLADIKYKAGNFEDVAYFEPYYLKDFVGVKSKI